MVQTTQILITRISFQIFLMRYVRNAYKVQQSMKWMSEGEISFFVA